MAEIDWRQMLKSAKSEIILPELCSWEACLITLTLYIFITWLLHKRIVVYAFLAAGPMRFDPINSGGGGKCCTQKKRRRECLHPGRRDDIMTMTKVRCTIKVNDGLVTSFSRMARRTFALFFPPSHPCRFPARCHQAVRRSLNSRRNGISIRGTSRGKCSEYWKILAWKKKRRGERAGKREAKVCAL